MNVAASSRLLSTLCTRAYLLTHIAYCTNRTDPLTTIYDLWVLRKLQELRIVLIICSSGTFEHVITELRVIRNVQIFTVEIKFHYPLYSSLIHFVRIFVLVLICKESRDTLNIIDDQSLFRLNIIT